MARPPALPRTKATSEPRSVARRRPRAPQALPSAEVELLAAPVPIVAGCSATTAARARAHFDEAGDDDDALRDVNVLYVDDDDRDAATLAPNPDGDAPPPPGLLRALGRGAAPDVAAEVAAFVADLLGDLAADGTAWKACGAPPRPRSSGGEGGGAPRGVARAPTPRFARRRGEPRVRRLRLHPRLARRAGVLRAAARGGVAPPPTGSSRPSKGNSPSSANSRKPR